MKFEFSAGGIVRKSQKSKVKSQKDQILILLAQHSQHHGWVFPKGLIGDNIKDEKKTETALREVREETGVLAKIIKPLEPVTYWYQLEQDPSASSGQEKRKKTVYYFLMEFIAENINMKDMEMENVEWLPINEVEKRLTYKSDQQVWREARKLIQ